MTMVFVEYLPMLAERGLNTDRIGVLGWSMGDCGAPLFAEIHLQVVAVTSESPDVWPSYAIAHAVDPGAFDSAADWQHYSVVSHTGELPRGAVRVNCGLSDPFLPASQDLKKLLQPHDPVVLTPGGHDATFWAANGPAQIRFICDYLF
jgi:hypothetical protein